MTKSTVTKRNAAPAREPRPFLYLKPARLPLGETAVDPVGLVRLEQAISPMLGHLTTSLIDHTIARHNARQRHAPQPIAMSVLNRRRRAARSWLLAIAAGKVDAATCHAVSTQYLPLLCGTGPDLARAARPGRELIEFVRGAVTACIFDGPEESLLPHARALFVLENTLATHLAAVLSHRHRRPASDSGAR